MNGREQFGRITVEWSSEVLGFYTDTGLRPDGDLRKFIEIFISGFGEVNSSLESLCLSESLMRFAKPRTKSVSPEQYVRYVVSSYLQEMYILRERLQSYRKKLMRFYAKLDWESQFSRETESLSQLVHESFDRIVSTRGSHVHEARYTDAELETLSQVELMSRFGAVPVASVGHHYDLSRRRWLETMVRNNQELDRVLDVYFAAMCRGVTRDGELVWPDSEFAAHKDRFRLDACRPAAAPSR